MSLEQVDLSEFHDISSDLAATFPIYFEGWTLSRPSSDGETPTYLSKSDLIPARRARHGTPALGRCKFANITS